MIKGFSKEYLAKKSLVYEKIIMKKVLTYYQKRFFTEKNKTEKITQKAVQ